MEKIHYEKDAGRFIDILIDPKWQYPKYHHQYRNYIYTSSQENCL